MKNNIIKIGVLLLGINLVACLDDAKYALDPAGVNNTIGFLDQSVPSSPSGAIYPAWIRAFGVSAVDQFEQTIKFEGPNSNDKDIVLTLEVDPLALDEYNRQQSIGLNGGDPLGGSTYELLPDANYDIGSLTLTIPKGERTTSLAVTVYPEEFDLSKKYALPVRIASSSSGVLNAHFSVAILVVVIKNQFDAAYEASIWHTGWAANGIYSSTVPLIYPEPGIALATTGPDQNQLSNLYRGDNLCPAFDSGEAPTGFGAASPIFTFDLNLTSVDIDADPATPEVMVNRIILVDNATPDDGRGRDFFLDPAAPASDNWFNPADRSMNARFIMVQTGRPEQTMHWDLTFTGERP